MLKDKKMYAKKIIDLIKLYVELHNSLSESDVGMLGAAVDVLEKARFRADK